MSWRISVRHLSRYRYAEPVVASYNEVRMVPISGRNQTVLASELVVNPTTPIYRYSDYWRTAVHSFDIHEPHTELCISASSVVETAVPEQPDTAVTWEEVLDPVTADRFAELLTSTAYTPLVPELADIARGAADGSLPLGAVEAIVAWVGWTMRYQAGATHVSTSATEAWHRGAGVCQDFAHLTLVLLRHLGIPARYVSGYMHPDAAAELGVPVAGTSHAWVEAWLGTWYAIDPTSGLPVGSRHVTVGRGRDYRDVAPLTGVYHGGALRSLDVEVELTRIA